VDILTCGEEGHLFKLGIENNDSYHPDISNHSYHILPQADTASSFHRNKPSAVMTEIVDTLAIDLRSQHFWRTRLQA